MNGNTYCMGIECPVRNRCLRYTSGIDAKINDGTLDKFERKCTNQKSLYKTIAERLIMVKNKC